jgi:dihydrofolate reductase
LLKPLPDRTTVVITRQVSYEVAWPGAAAGSLEEALSRLPPAPVFIIGGAEIYREAIEKDLVGRIYLTRIHTKVVGGDAFFPVFNLANWVLTDASSTDTNVCEVTFETYERRKNGR